MEHKMSGWERVRRVKDMSHGLVLLLAGELDVLVDERRHSQREIVFMGVDSVRILEPSIEKIPLYHYVHKKNADLIPKLTRVLEKMTDDGKIN